MKLPKKIASLLTVTLVASNVGTLSFADTSQNVPSEKLIGAGRWETAIEVSKKGWTKATEAVIVNDNAIADALAATPFAEAKNAPILLTGKDKLDERTTNELKRLGVKKVYLIGGEAVLSKSIEAQLENQKFEIDRIHGATRELTGLEIANRLNKIKKVTEIAVVNGTTGLADAVSIAATAAKKDMAIILSNPNEGTKASDEFIKSNGIKTSYIIGGPKAISKEVENKLPNPVRIEGIDRNETNAKVLEKFYTEKELKNAYVAKDGMGKEDQLIDALAVGVLAAKNDSPVIIVGNKLNEMQKDITNTKSFETVTQVGGNGNETAFNELKTMQGVTTYEVNTVAQLNDALAKADANDAINVRSLSNNTRSNNTINFESDNAIYVNLHDNSKSYIVNMGNGTFVAYGNHSSIDIENANLVIIKGTVGTVNVLKGGNVSISNEEDSKPNVTVAEGASVKVDGKINTITVNGKDTDVIIDKNCTVNKIEVSKDAGNNDIKIEGKVDSAVTNAPNVNIDNNGTLGGNSGTHKPNITGNTVKPPSGGGGGGVSTGGGTKPADKLSEYGFKFEMPDKVVEGKEETLDMTLKTITENQLGYSNALIKVAVTSPDGGNVKLLATDTNNNELDIAKLGQWGPDGGFAISKDYNATTPVKATFSKAGKYTIELKLVDVKENNKVITSETITVDVSPASWDETIENPKFEGEDSNAMPIPTITEAIQDGNFYLSTKNGSIFVKFKTNVDLDLNTDKVIIEYLNADGTPYYRNTKPFWLVPSYQVSVDKDSTRYDEMLNCRREGVCETCKSSSEGTCGIKYPSSTNKIMPAGYYSTSLSRDTSGIYKETDNSGIKGVRVTVTNKYGSWSVEKFR